MLQDKLKQRDLEIWVVTAWALWNARNKFYFHKIQLQPSTIADGALAFSWQSISDLWRLREDHDVFFIFVVAM